MSADRKSVYIYNGTATPQMQTLTVSTGIVTGQSFPYWGTPNNISYGGIAVYGTGVFVTDGYSYQDTNSQTQEGLVRFDTAGGATVRFAGGNSYQDDTVGGNGLLYALSTSGTIDVYSPVTDAKIRTINLDNAAYSSDIRGIAVDAYGFIYAAGWDGTVKALDANGNTLRSLTTGTSNLTDIDLNNAGQLLVAGRFGQVISTNTALTTETSFNVSGGDTIHVAWASPIIPGVPEPATASTVVAVAAVALSRRRRRGQRN